MPPAADADHAGEGGVGAGEGALAVAEQLALEHVARHGRAVEREQRPVGAVGGAVDGAREHFLAGAGLAGEEDRQRRRGDAAGDAAGPRPSARRPRCSRGRRRAPRRARARRAAFPRGGSGRACRAVPISLRMRDQRAAMFELGPRIDEEEQGLVAMCADGIRSSSAGSAGRGGRLRARSSRALRPRGGQPRSWRRARRRRGSRRRQRRRWLRAPGCADVRQVPGARRRSRGSGGGGC